MQSPVISVTQLSVGYDEEPDILTDVSFQVYRNDLIGIHGPNGGGKTTLIKALLGLLKPRQGTIHYYTPTGAIDRSPNIGYVRQLNLLDRAFPISVREVVEGGLHKPPLRRLTPSDHAAVECVLQLVGMEQYHRSAIGQLSGGQFQRVLLARALVAAPEILILDEPTTYVDAHFEEQLHQIILSLAKEMTILLVSHDLEAVNELSNRRFYVNRTLREEPL